MLCCQFANDSEFLFFERNPCWVVWIAVYHCCHIAILQFLFKFSAECFASVRENVKLLPFDAQYSELAFLYRETRVDEEHLVLCLVTLAACNETAE